MAEAGNYWVGAAKEKAVLRTTTHCQGHSAPVSQAAEATGQEAMGLWTTHIPDLRISPT